MKGYAMLRELNLNEMESVSGGEDGGVVSTGTINRHGATSIYPGTAAWDDLMRQFSDPHFGLSEGRYGPGGGSGNFEAPTDDESSQIDQCAAATSMLDSIDSSNTGHVISAFRDLMSGQFGQSNSRDADALMNAYLRHRAQQDIEEHC